MMYYLIYIYIYTTRIIYIIYIASNTLFFLDTMIIIFVRSRNYHDMIKLKKINFYAILILISLVQFNDTQYAYMNMIRHIFFNEFVQLTVRVRIYHNNTTII